jgi:hypothetical protein
MSRGSSQNRRLRYTLAVTAALFLLVLAWFVWRPTEQGEEESFSHSTGEFARVRPRPSPLQAPPVTEPRIAAGVPSPSPDSKVNTAQVEDNESPFDPRLAIAMTKELIEDYRRRSEFPPSSRPVESPQDPILAEREISPVSAGGPEGEEPLLTVFPEQLVFEFPDSAVIFAYLTAGGQRVAAQSMEGTLLTEDLQEVGTVLFRDDGEGGDAMAGDFLYTARIQPPAGNERAASFLVRVRAVLDDRVERRAGTSFQYSRPGARLTGAFQDSIEGGSLRIDVQLDVDEPGIFHLSGTLYDANGNPVGLAQNRIELAAGQHWVPLVYYGRIFHPDPRTGRQAASGPFELRFVSLLNVTTMPNAVSRLWETHFWTRPYRAADFTSEPFNDPFYTEAIAHEEAELERLQALATAGGEQ